MADIKTLKVDNELYYIKDEEARKVLEQLTGDSIFSTDTVTHASISDRIANTDSTFNNTKNGTVTAPGDITELEEYFLNGKNEWTHLNGGAVGREEFSDTIQSRLHGITFEIVEDEIPPESNEEEEESESESDEEQEPVTENS